MKKPIDVTAKEQLLSDFRVVMDDVEALLKATADQGGEELAELRTRARKSLKHMKVRMTETQDELFDKANDAVQSADSYVHDNPWNAIGIAAGIGMVIGMLTSRH